MFSGNTPNAVALSTAADTAATWAPNADSGMPPSSNQRFAEWASVSVSCVVKVLEETTTKVVARRQSAQGLMQRPCVGVGYEVHAHMRLALAAKRLLGHAWPQI